MRCMNERAPTLLHIWQDGWPRMVPCLEILFAGDACQISRSVICRLVRLASDMHLQDWDQPAGIASTPDFTLCMAACRSLSHDARVYWQLQQARTKITVKTTTKSQRFSLAIKPDREATIRYTYTMSSCITYAEQKWPPFLLDVACLPARQFWEETRGVQDLACLHRFANFARIYPRFRDLDYLRVFMPQWDSAIDRIIAHDRHAAINNNKLKKEQMMVLHEGIKS